jgi:hypothetical protein
MVPLTSRGAQAETNAAAESKSSRLELQVGMRELEGRLVGGDSGAANGSLVKYATTWGGADRSSSFGLAVRSSALRIRMLRQWPRSRKNTLGYSQLAHGGAKASVSPERVKKRIAAQQSAGSGKAKLTCSACQQVQKRLAVAEYKIGP